MPAKAAHRGQHRQAAPAFDSIVEWKRLRIAGVLGGCCGPPELLRFSESRSYRPAAVALDDTKGRPQARRSQPSPQNFGEAAVSTL